VRRISSLIEGGCFHIMPHLSSLFLLLSSLSLFLSTPFTVAPLDKNPLEYILYTPSFLSFRRGADGFDRFFTTNPLNWPLRAIYSGVLC
jgi:uncharacterized membrane protein SirB2